MNDEQRNHLNILSICYFVLAGLNLFSLGVIGAMATMLYEGLKQANTGTSEPRPFGLTFEGFMTLILAASVGMVLVMMSAYVLAGVLIRKRRSRTLALVCAAIGCLSVPLGTVLGVFTFIVLGKPEVRAAFAGRHDMEPHEPGR